MKFRLRVLVTYGSQFYMALAGILLVPVYIEYLGAEAYGVVGFYTMLNAVLQLLDIGLTPTASRSIARFTGGAMPRQMLRDLLRTLQVLFWGVGVIAAIVISAASGWISREWLEAETLSHIDMQISIAIIGCVIGARWISAFYRSVIVGFQAQHWLAGFNILISTARFVGVVAVLHFAGASLYNFFIYQFLVAIIEVVVIAIFARNLVPAPDPSVRSRGLNWAPLGTLLGFSLSIAITSTIWVAVTQIDKILLSGILSLTDYGYFSLAVVAANVIALMSGPLNITLLPRLSELEGQQDTLGFELLYRQASQIMSAIIFPVMTTVALWSTPLLYAWTGSTETSENAGPILSMYVIGNGIMAISAFAYYLQFAIGKLNLHIIGSILFALILIPSIITAATMQGAVAAGAVWAIVNMIYFIGWVSLVHVRLRPGLYSKWILSDIAPPACAAVASALVLFLIIPLPEHRFHILAIVMAAGTISLCAASMASCVCRNYIKEKIYG